MAARRRTIESALPLHPSRRTQREVVEVNLPLQLNLPAVRTALLVEQVGKAHSGPDLSQ